MQTPMWVEVRSFRRMQTAGCPLDEIVIAFDHKYSADQITNALTAQREYDRVTRGSNESAAPWLGPNVKPVEVPADVLADRERRLLIPPASLTALMFGDPPRGYSAADKPRVASGTLAPHPVDLLSFRGRRGKAKSGTRYG